MQRFNKSTYLLLIGFFMFSGLIQAQDLPVFRIGILDNDAESLSRGARLAIDRINAAGGVSGADGTEFRLEAIIQSADDMEAAIGTLQQANVIAVIGPATSDNALGNLVALQGLNVPVLTTASDDTLLIQDQTERLIRIRTRDAIRGRALADYLVTEFPENIISTVQLDLESTASLIGFTEALRSLSVQPDMEFLLEDEVNSIEFVAAVSENEAEILVAFGAPELVRDFYTRLIAEDWSGLFVYNRADHEDFKIGLSVEQLDNIIGATTWSYASSDEISRAFVGDYASFYDKVPDELSAAAYDAVLMLEMAIAEPGNLLDNLTTLESFDGVQGLLNSDILPAGETSANVTIFETTGYGGQRVLAKYLDDTRLEMDLPDDTDNIIATFTPTVTQTFTPAPTLTPSVPTLIITRAVQNVRTGPGLNYDVIGQLNQGEQRPIIGGNVDLSWVAIDYRGQTGWLSAGILDIFGDRNRIPILQSPPTPTPPPTPLPTATPLPPAIADIVITGAQPNKLTAGSSFSVSVTVRNQGFANAGPFAVATSMQPGSVYTAQNLNGLAAGQSTTITLTGTLGTATGPQTIVIIADLNDQVAEGAVGEANNSTFNYTYMVDAPVFSSGSLTLADGASVSLDSGTPDIAWAGGTLSPVGTTTLATLNGTTFANVHRDQISSASLSAIPITTVPVGAIIGVFTDGGTLYGVLEVTGATVGGNLTFNFRVYS